MKKLLCLALALLCCLVLATVVSAEAANPEDSDIDVSLGWNCARCNQSVLWEVLPDSIPTTPGHYHYYLTGSVSHGQITPKAGVTVCLDLCGYGIDVNGRAMIVYNGATVNIMDSSEAKTGYIAGSDRRSNNPAGGTVTVQENGTLNLYSGTLKFDASQNTTAVENGGTVYLKQNSADKTKSAVMNMYGGRVEGGALVSTSTEGGATIHVSTGARLNVYSGTITSGQLGGTAVGACVLLDSSSAKMTLSGNANVEEIYTKYHNILTISGEYSGTARLKLHSDASEGLAVGISDGAEITGDLFCTNDSGWLVEPTEEETLVLAAFTPSGERHLCAHCQEIVKWTQLTGTVCTTLKNTAGSYHCYLSANFNRSTQISLAEGSRLCLDLYGKDLTVSQRAMYIQSNAQLSIMDSVGGGELVGTTGTNNPSGGVMVIKTGATVNLYSGTLRLNDIYKEGYGVGTGGIVYMSDSGTLNVKGGTIQGADLVMSEYTMSTNGKGAAIFMSNSAQLNVTGGRIANGTLAEGCEGSCVYLNSKTCKVNVSGNGTVDDIFCKYENDQVTISGVYTGGMNLTYPSSIALEEGQAVGVSDGADLTSAATGCGSQWMLGVSGDDLVLVPNATVVVQTGTETVPYTSLQSAIDNAAEGNIVKMLKPVTENVSLSKDLILDLNGKTITGTVTVPAGVTLYGKDSQTDDFTVQDAAGYGKLTVSGQGTVTGLDTGDLIYVMITEETGISFHGLDINLKYMTLRPENAGIYYKSGFAGDELIAQRVLKFGVALSLKGTPALSNIDDCILSVIPGDFTSGGMDTNATSTLVKNVMKATNPALINNRNAQLPIYGRAYILTEDGYVLGKPAQRSFRQQVELSDAMWTDASMTAEKKAAMVAMYDKFRDVMKSWNIPNIIAQKDPASDNVLKILGIGNSYTHDSMWMLYNIYKAENPDKEVVLGIAYHSGCSLSQHVGYINNSSLEYDFHKLNDEIYDETGKWKTVKDVTLKSIVENENWDIVTIQQASTYSGRPETYNGDIDIIQQFVTRNLGYTPTFAWNMTWAYPTEDIEGDAFTTVNTNNGFAYYDYNKETMFNAIVDTVKAKIVPNETFSYIMPAGIAVQNAWTSYLGDPDLYRDYTHLNDFARVMAAYTWYCTFENVRLESLEFTVIPRAIAKSYITAGGTGDMVLTDAQIEILIESVNNALTTRDSGTFQSTQSQYTTKP